MPTAAAVRRRGPIQIKKSRVLLYIFVTATVVFTALPFVYVTVSAFKPISELFVFPPRFFVRNPTLNNFRELVVSFSSSSVPFLRYLFNSLFNAFVTVAISVVVCTMAAFGLVKHRPRGSKIYFLVIIGALMFSPHVTQIPNYLVVSKLGWINTYFALIIPKVAGAYNLFLLKQFMEQIPDEIIESARIDGAGECRVLVQIVAPFLKPAWATLIVFSFTANWNDFFSPLVFTVGDAMKTLPLALQSIAGGAGAAVLGRAGAVAAASLLMILPTVAIYLLMQRQVMETMMHSGIKV